MITGATRSGDRETGESGVDLGRCAANHELNVGCTDRYLSSVNGKDHPRRPGDGDSVPRAECGLNTLFCSNCESLL